MSYSKLRIQPCGHTAVLPSRAVPAPERLSLEAPALAALSDFTRECPLTVRPDHPIDEALAEMIRVGVRALLVMSEGRLLGLVTSFDIQGERPILFLQSANCLQEKCRFRDVHVGDIMTPCAEAPALAFEQLRDAHLGDLAETFRHTDATHLLVIETCGAQREIVLRGLLSRSHLMRLLGELPPVTGTAELPV
ncbi:CBS domain containing protein [mine drainage metagenome]